MRQNDRPPNQGLALQNALMRPGLRPYSELVLGVLQRNDTG